MKHIMTQNPYYTTLLGRGLIQIEGDDRHDFLQRLISNDIENIAPNSAVYACLLTPQGKFLHDFFVTEGDGVLLIECEGGERAQDLYKRLNMYRLRADVKISVEDNIPVYAVFGANPTLGYPDPRHNEMGWRSFEKPQDMPEQPFETWDKHRISLTIPDGSRDLIPEKSTLAEARMDKINGLSYDKGCYVGQEPTARVHYRGLSKKHLYTINGDNLPAPFEDINIEDKRIGEMRSSCGGVGLALLKDKYKDTNLT